MHRVNKISGHLQNAVEGSHETTEQQSVLRSDCIGEMENRQVEDAKSASSYQRVAIKIAFPDTSQADERYGGSGDVAILEGELLLPKTKSKTVFVFMHPYVYF